MNGNPLLNKMHWQVAARLPGPQSWDKMAVVGQGLRPLTQTASDKENTLPEQVQANPFLRNAWIRAFSRQGIPVIKDASSMKLAAGKLDAWKHLWRAFRGSAAGSRSASSLGRRLGMGNGGAWGKLFRESANGGAYNGMTHQIGPAIGRTIGGAYLGHQFDSSDENAVPLGTILGGVAGLGSPAAVRKLLGNRAAPKGSLRRLFSDRTMSRRMVNDPLNRVMLSAATGNLVDMGAGALGYDTGGWGERIGIAGGLAGGMRPLSQALAGRYKTVDTALRKMKAIPGLGTGFQRAQRGGFTHLPAYLLGSPYATGTGTAAMMGMMTHGALDATVGERVRSLAEKKKMITGAMNSTEMQPAMQMMERTLQQLYGPEAKLYDPDGTPSKEALILLQRLGQYGMMQLQNAGHNYFGNSNYMLDPNNWQRLSSPMSAMGDFIRGQATRFNPLPF